MKSVKIGDFVIVERSRHVDRKSNILHVEFSYEKLFGLPRYKEDMEIEQIITCNVSEQGSFNSLAWSLVKDLDRDGMMIVLFNELLSYLDGYLTIVASDGTPGYDASSALLSLQSSLVLASDLIPFAHRLFDRKTAVADITLVDL